VAVGEELRFGIPRRGFIMTAEVDGEDLVQVYQKIDDADQCHILEQNAGPCWGDCTIVDFSDRPASKTSSIQALPAVTQSLLLSIAKLETPIPGQAAEKILSNDCYSTFADRYRQESASANNNGAGFAKTIAALFQLNTT
jgi:hypothetical protein